MEALGIETYGCADAGTIEHLARNNQQRINLHLNNIDETTDGVADTVTFLGAASDAASLLIPGDLVPSMQGLPTTPTPGTSINFSVNPITDTTSTPGLFSITT